VFSRGAISSTSGFTVTVTYDPATVAGPAVADVTTCQLANPVDVSATPNDDGLGNVTVVLGSLTNFAGASPARLLIVRFTALATGTFTSVLSTADHTISNVVYDRTMCVVDGTIEVNILDIGTVKDCAGMVLGNTLTTTRYAGDGAGNINWAVAPQTVDLVTGEFTYSQGWPEVLFVRTMFTGPLDATVASAADAQRIADIRAGLGAPATAFETEVLNLNIDATGADAGDVSLALRYAAGVLTQYQTITGIPTMWKFMNGPCGAPVPPTTWNANGSAIPTQAPPFDVIAFPMGDLDKSFTAAGTPAYKTSGTETIVLSLDKEKNIAYLWAENVEERNFTTRINNCSAQIKLVKTMPGLNAQGGMNEQFGFFGISGFLPQGQNISKSGVLNPLAVLQIDPNGNGPLCDNYTIEAVTGSRKISFRVEEVTTTGRLDISGVNTQVYPNPTNSAITVNPLATLF